MKAERERASGRTRCSCQSSAFIRVYSSYSCYSWSAFLCSPPQPALAFLQDHLFQRVDPAVVVVQARAAEQLLAAGVAEHLRRLVADLVDRLQAVGREARRHDEDALDALLRQLRQHVVGVRLEPLAPGLLEQRLERLRPLVAPPAEALDQLPRRPLDLRGVGVAGLGVADGDAVEADDEMVRLPRQLRQLLTHDGADGVEVAGVFVVRRD